MKKILLSILVCSVWFQSQAQQTILQERNYLSLPNYTQIYASDKDNLVKP